MMTLPVVTVDDIDEDDEQGEGSTEEGAGSTVEGSTRDEALTNSTKGSTEVVVEGSIEMVVEGSTKVVEGSIEELGASIDSTDDDGTRPTVWLTDDEDAKETLLLGRLWVTNSSQKQHSMVASNPASYASRINEASNDEY
ncbi:hypothetical protein Pyn_09241 [Prunus yedoensis var. nudiflora]|uniref:Uncharacterized protein n=1 Tax=Prunus yedoensis var. nudiflora TaxID=2094558 RepID=A0A314XRA2_PRUYE|nr:hypothetical protein Pyn_09241 [Prunus yedoensis var. nudiflora]